MNSINFPPAVPSGYLADGTPVFALFDVAASHGLTTAGCIDAFDDFYWWLSRQQGGTAMLQAGVMRADDKRIHRTH